MEELEVIASPENPALSRTPSTLSLESSLSGKTFLPTGGLLGASLEHFCRLIDAYPSLQDAEIISSECYQEPINMVLMHRFLLLELRRHKRKTIWVRLERLRDRLQSNRRFLLAGAQTRANDSVSAPLQFRGNNSHHRIRQVRIGASKKDLIGIRGQCENHQVFSTLPRLGELRHLIHVVGHELPKYKLLSVNISAIKVVAGIRTHTC